jgi:MFS family permease
MMIPSLPDHLRSLGGEEHVGLIIFLFTVTALISRPFSGKLSDQWGRVPVMILGAAVSGIAALLYPIALAVIPFFAVRMFHGFSTGFKPTGTAAFVSDIVPADRRGEAMGILGFCSNLGSAISPAIGPSIVDKFGMNTMFFVSTGLAVLSVAVLGRIKETLENRRKLDLQMFRLYSSDLIEPRVITSSLVLALSVFALGGILTLGPDLSNELGIENEGLYFTLYVLASLVVRIAAGKASDKYGRVPVLKVTLPILVIAVILLGFASNIYLFFAGSICMGFAMGMISPTIYAWTIDQSISTKIGRGIATMYIALEAGIGLGAVTTGYIYHGTGKNFLPPFLICGLLAIVGFIILFRTKPKPIESLQNS